MLVVSSIALDLELNLFGFSTTYTVLLWTPTYPLTFRRMILLLPPWDLASFVLTGRTKLLVRYRHVRFLQDMFLALSILIVIA